jgi:hypothetical protein
MASRTFKDASSVTQQALVHRDAANSNDLPLYKPVYGADGADPTIVTRTAGLPIVGQRTSGSPTTGTIKNATASAGATGNSVAIGGTGGSAVPGTFVVTADPDNATVVVIGGTDANAAARSGTTSYVQGVPLLPGASYVVDTDDLRSWKLAVRTAHDAVAWCKVGS